ncbi:MAG: hypothetical protein KH297_04620 [Firmicutes bacterium]|nr:hypothetical protein [Bacillota bacterium]
MGTKSKSIFSEEDILKILKNPNVEKVRRYGQNLQIVYTEKFKKTFISEIESKGASAIFTEAGLPSKLIGGKRIERATYRWKKKMDI